MQSPHSSNYTLAVNFMCMYEYMSDNESLNLNLMNFAPSSCMLPLMYNNSVYKRES